MVSLGLSRQISVVDSDPFLAFSTEDIAGMDKEVEDILSGESDSEEVRLRFQAVYRSYKCTLYSVLYIHIFFAVLLIAEGSEKFAFP